MRTEFHELRTSGLPHATLICARRSHCGKGQRSVRGDESMDMVQWLSSKSSRSIADESIAGLLGDTIGRSKSGRTFWWIVTDLVNPAAAYHREFHHNVPSTPEITERLAYGKWVHDQAGYRFRYIPGFTTREAAVDGAVAGLGGIRGRIDFRIGSSLVELKTAQEIPTQVEAVFMAHPHDVEQLALYALMTRRERDSHWLLYFSRDDPPKAFAFKLEVTREGPLRQYFRARMGQMDRALETRDPTPLGRCRYFNSGCDFDRARICGCSHLDPPAISELHDSLRVKADPEFASLAARAMVNGTVRTNEQVGLWDLLTPRHAFLRLGPGRKWVPIEEEGDYQLRRGLERRILASDLGVENRRLMLGGQPGEPRALAGRSLILTINQTNKDGVNRVQFPLLVRVSRQDPAGSWAGPLSVYIAQLAAHCAMNQLSEGVILVVYPDHPGLAISYRVTFSDLEGILTRLNDSYNDLVKAIESGRPDGLVGCPDWFKKLCGTSCLCE